MTEQTLHDLPCISDGELAEVDPAQVEAGRKHIAKMVASDPVLYRDAFSLDTSTDDTNELCHLIERELQRLIDEYLSLGTAMVDFDTEDAMHASQMPAVKLGWARYELQGVVEKTGSIRAYLILTDAGGGIIDTYRAAMNLRPIAEQKGIERRQWQHNLRAAQAMAATGIADSATA